jgi:hypothetical protein
MHRLTCDHLNPPRILAGADFFAIVSTNMPKYSRKSQQKVAKVMHEYKHGQLTSGKSGKKVKSRKQAIAIGLSEARQAGAKVPSKKKSSSKR